MRNAKHILAIGLLICLSVFACEVQPQETAEKPTPPNQDLSQLILPDGFEISIYADSIENARSMCMGPKGTLFVGTRTAGKLWAIQDKDGDYKADKVYLLAAGLNMPNGVAFRDGSLYLAEVSQITRYDDIENKLDSPPIPVVVNDEFPTEDHHGWKYIAFGPDDKLYVPIGAPCNICYRPDDKRYASITRMNPDGSDLEVYAHGIRNSVGFAWHPETKALWFTDNGRDWLGDDSPSDELNHAPEAGMHFGYPHCHAGDLLDAEFAENHLCEEFTPPVQKLGAHVAALGMLFYTGDMFPPEFKNNLLICQHGSWNKSIPDGYRVSRVQLDGDKAIAHTPFVEGWLKDDEPWGRPVALLQLKDGSVLVSDDYGNRIYRITYQN